MILFGEARFISSGQKPLSSSLFGTTIMLGVCNLLHLFSVFV